MKEITVTKEEFETKYGQMDMEKLKRVGEISNQQIEPGLLSKIGGITKKVGGFIAKSEVEFGKDIAGAIIPQTKEFQGFQESRQGLMDMQNNISGSTPS